RIVFAYRNRSTAISSSTRWLISPRMARTSDEELSLLCRLFGELLRSRLTKIEANLLHGSLHFRVDALAWRCAGRYGASLVWVCELVEEGGHLRPPGVRHTREDNLQHLAPLDAARRPEARGRRCGCGSGVRLDGVHLHAGRGSIHVVVRQQLRQFLVQSRRVRRR